MNKISGVSHGLISALVLLLGLTACSTMPEKSTTITTTLQDGPPPFPVMVAQIQNASPKYEPKSTYGNPAVYEIQGKRYYVMDSAKGYSKIGMASWYGTKFHGKLTANHEHYDMLAMTAASPTLPLPTYVRVTNLENGRQVVVKVNDRGPFCEDRIMDLSYAAAKKLGYAEKGTAKVKVEAIIFEEPNKAPGKTPLMLADNNLRPPAERKLYVQVGAFQQIHTAQQVKAKVTHLTHQSARIETVNLNDKTLYRVQVGPLQDLQKSTVVNQLLQQGYSHLVAVFS
jgi:peptidoglycan lytic transglycosylase